MQLLALNALFRSEDVKAVQQTSQLAWPRWENAPLHFSFFYFFLEGRGETLLRGTEGYLCPKQSGKQRVKNLEKMFEKGPFHGLNCCGADVMIQICESLMNYLWTHQRYLFKRSFIRIRWLLRNIPYFDGWSFKNFIWVIRIWWVWSTDSWYRGTFFYSGTKNKKSGLEFNGTTEKNRFKTEQHWPVDLWFNSTLKLVFKYALEHL